MTPLNVPGAPSNVTYFMRLENDPNKVHLYAFENTADFNTKPQLMHADKVSGRPFSMLRCSNMTLRNGRIYVTCTQKVSDRVPNVRPGRSDIRVLVFPVKLEEKTFPSFGKYIHFSLDDGPGQRDLVFGRNNPVDDKPGDIFSYEAPAMAVNKDGDIVVVYARVPVKTAPGAFSDTRYTTIYHNEIKQRPSIQLHAGEFLPQTVYDCDHGDTSPTVISYNDKPGSNGYLIDLGCAVVDPEDDRSFWVIHCYAKKPKKEPYYHKNDQAGCYKFEAFSMPVIGKIKL
jgi:hypothetical protein